MVISPPRMIHSWCFSVSDISELVYRANLQKEKEKAHMWFIYHDQVVALPEMLPLKTIVFKSFRALHELEVRLRMSLWSHQVMWNLCIPA